MLPPEEGHILVKNHMFLLGNLSADEMKHHLYQRGIITEHQMEVIEASPTSKEKNEKLLKFIKRHKDGYKALMEILDHPDFRTTGIADKLRATDISQIRDIRKWSVVINSYCIVLHQLYKMMCFPSGCWQLRS